MRPSGRKAMRQGRLNVATWVIVNGRLGSGFNAPALIWAYAEADTSMSRRTALGSVFMISRIPFRCLDVETCGQDLGSRTATRKQAMSTKGPTGAWLGLQA